jgi:hypothetical protein
MEEQLAEVPAQDSITVILRSIFIDVLEFDQYAVPALVDLVKRQPRDLRIYPNHIMMQNGINKLRLGSHSKEQKKLLENLRTILCCAYVLLYAQRQQDVTQQEYLAFFDKCLVDSMFLSSYNDHSPTDRRDVPHLLNYYKYLKLAIELLPPSRNKGLAIQIASRLDGSGQVYILGSGQKDAATRREAIYHLATGHAYQSSVPNKTSTVPFISEERSDQGSVCPSIQPTDEYEVQFESAVTPSDPIQANMVKVLGQCEELLRRIKNSKRKRSQISSAQEPVEDWIQSVWRGSSTTAGPLKRPMIAAPDYYSGETSPSSAGNSDSIGTTSIDDTFDLDYASFDLY